MFADQTESYYRLIIIQSRLWIKPQSCHTQDSQFYLTTINAGSILTKKYKCIYLYVLVTLLHTCLHLESILKFQELKLLMDLLRCSNLYQLHGPIDNLCYLIVIEAILHSYIYKFYMLCMIIICISNIIMLIVCLWPYVMLLYFLYTISYFTLMFCFLWLSMFLLLY